MRYSSLLLVLMLFGTGCRSTPSLKAGYYKMGTSEDTELSAILAKADIKVSLGYVGGSYRIGKDRASGVDIREIEALLSRSQERELAVIYEQINYSPQRNDSEKAEILSLLKDHLFETIVITSGTGNSGGTHILKVIRHIDEEKLKTVTKSAGE